MNGAPIARRRPKGARRASPLLFEFNPDLDKYLRSQSKRESKTMVQFVEELLRLHKNLKHSQGGGK